MKIGFLPLYIKLYDDIGTKRDEMTAFYEKVTVMFKERGLELTMVFTGLWICVVC